MILKQKNSSLYLKMKIWSYVYDHDQPKFWKSYVYKSQPNESDYKNDQT